MIACYHMLQNSMERMHSYSKTIKKVDVQFLARQRGQQFRAPVAVSELACHSDSRTSQLRFSTTTWPEIDNPISKICTLQGTCQREFITQRVLGRPRQVCSSSHSRPCWSGGKLIEAFSQRLHIYLIKGVNAISSDSINSLCMFTRSCLHTVVTECYAIDQII